MNTENLLRVFLAFMVIVIVGVIVALVLNIRRLYALEKKAEASSTKQVEMIVSTRSCADTLNVADTANCQQYVVVKPHRDPESADRQMAIRICLGILIMLITLLIQGYFECVSNM